VSHSQPVISKYKEIESISEKKSWPAVPDGKAGWPWVAPATPDELRPRPKGLPRLSVVVVSFNQAVYLEEAIRSLLLQEYPDLEIFIADGGSVDGSVEIIRRYEPFLSGWLSERDSGQSEAINKGFARCTGVIVNWLCGDDILEPGALLKVGRHFLEHPETDVLSGAAMYRHEKQSELDYTRGCSEEDLKTLPALNNLIQPSCFFRRSLLQREPPVRMDLHYTMDWELWSYFLERKATWSFTKDVLSTYRATGTNKSFVGGGKILREMLGIYRRYCNELVPLTFWFRWFLRPMIKRANVPKRTVVSRGFGRLALITRHILNCFYSSSRIRGLQKAFEWYDH
jgi:glycosyltransferase involved in cell wall biosynthesis